MAATRLAAQTAAVICSRRTNAVCHAPIQRIRAAATWEHTNGRRIISENKIGTFVDQPPSIAQGGKGVVVPGCVPCKKHCNTHTSFLEHLTNDVLPKIIEGLRGGN